MSYVYIFSNESMPGIYKVGKTNNRLNERVKELYTAATGVPTPFKIESHYQVYNCDAVERRAHQLLHHCRVNKGREFFRQEKAVIEEAILTAIEQTGDTLGKDSLTFADIALRRQAKEKQRQIAEARQKETERRKEQDLKVAQKKAQEAAELEHFRRLAVEKENKAKRALYWKQWGYSLFVGCLTWFGLSLFDSDGSYGTPVALLALITICIFGVWLDNSKALGLGFTVMITAFLFALGEGDKRHWAKARDEGRSSVCRGSSTRGRYYSYPCTPEEYAERLAIRQGKK